MKKILFYILIIIFLFVGLLGPVSNVQAEDAGTAKTIGNLTTDQRADITEYACVLEHPLSGEGTLLGCVLKVVDGFFLSTFGFFFWAVAQVVNALIFLALSSFVYENTFVTNAWVVVRDFSNIFFIIILLYVAIKIILGLGGGEGKKMIAKVVIAALLINFSLFFTGVVIDASNILGLVFYNKVETLAVGDGAREYSPVLAFSGGEKDVTGGLVGNFMPSKLIGKQLVEKAKKPVTVQNTAIDISKDFLAITAVLSLFGMASSLIIIGIIVFIIIALAFINRIATLLFLLIFSPFAFMSFAFPVLGRLEYIGWDDWLKRLFKNAFFAPVFLFMLYFIFMLIKEGVEKTILGNDSQTIASFAQEVFGIFFGFNLIMLLLWFAIKFAFKASGKAGEMVVKGAKIAGTAALAVGTAGAGVLATSVVGGVAAKALGSTALKQKAAGGDLFARMQLRGAEWLSKKPVNIGGAVEKMTGLKVASHPATKLDLLNIEGGVQGRAERKVKKLREEAERYKTTETDEERKARVAEEEERRKEFDDKKEKARQAAGGDSMTEKAKEAFEENYKKQNGERPPVYETTEAFNNATMEKFQASLAERGLMNGLASTLARTIDKKNYNKDKEYGEEFKKKHGKDAVMHYDEDLVKKLNDQRIKNLKMTIGPGAALGESKYAKELGKEIKKVESVGSQIDKMKELLKDQTGVLERGMDLGVSEKMIRNGKEVKDAHGNTMFTVNRAALEDKLAKTEAEGKAMDSEMAGIGVRQAGLDEKSEAFKELEGRKKKIAEKMMGHIKEVNILKEMKGIEQTLANTRKNLDDLTGKKSGIDGESSSGTTPTPTK